MNPDTGAITPLTDEQAKEVNRLRAENGKAPLLKLKRPPKASCKKCRGRGHTGKNLVTGFFVQCSCTK